ncbi:MAG: NCS2 family permease [Rikenellaceae bacterium]
MTLESIFKLSEKGSTPRTELLGGVTTFMTMAYILIVNPSILAATGMDSGAVFTATAVSSALACFMMGLIANLPIALAPGMGINAFFAYTIVLQMGYSWETALAAVFVEGVIFILLSLLNIREYILRSIPLVLKCGIAIGIGLFITYIGLINSGIIVKGEPISKLGDLTAPQAALTLITVAIIGVLTTRKVRGALLIGMVISAVIGACMGVVTLPEGFSAISMPSSIAPVFMKLDFSQLLSFDIAIVIFTLIFADIFDTAGSLFAVTSRSGLIDKQGNVKNAKGAFLADAISTTCGAMIGTSTVTSYVESLSGIEAGGRTGLTAIVVGVMFLCALFFSPLFALVPVAATSAVLIVVGLFMIASISSIDFTNYVDALPAFLTIIVIPFSGSISEGIVIGFLAYVVMRTLLGRFREISPMMYCLALLFLLKIVFMP